MENLPRLKDIFGSLDEAEFPAFWASSAGPLLQERVHEVQQALAGFDVISLQVRFTGRAFDPSIEVVLLQFSKPHGIRVQGQTFLQSFDYSVETTVRIAAHEMLHPPVQMDGAAARAALSVFSADPLILKIVHQHDPRWGYTSIEGLFNENLVQALDQLISEALGVGRNPADRWHNSDDGIHVLAAGFYALFRKSRWNETGGSLDAWLLKQVRVGNLKASNFHPVAARVMERPVDKLWPVTSRVPVKS